MADLEAQVSQPSSQVFMAPSFLGDSNMKGDCPSSYSSSPIHMIGSITESPENGRNSNVPIIEEEDIHDDENCIKVNQIELDKIDDNSIEQNHNSGEHCLPQSLPQEKCEIRDDEP